MLGRSIIHRQILDSAGAGLELNPYDEKLHQAAMRAHTALGDTAAIWP